MDHCKHRIMDKCKVTGGPCTYGPECFEPEELPVITNSDRLRSMGDEDLAAANVRRVWLTDGYHDWSEYVTSDEERFEYKEDAVAHELNWLRKPAEED